MYNIQVTREEAADLCSRTSMRVLIVHPCARPDPRGFSRWSAEVARCLSALATAGHQVGFLATGTYDEAELSRALEQHQPRLIAIHTESQQADQARAIGAFLAMHAKGATLFFTGPHPSAWPADCLNVASGVYALRGYADHLLPKIATALEKDGDFFSLPGLSFPVMNRFYHNAIEQPADLDFLPLPDRKLSNYASASAELRDSVGVEIETSRGTYNVSDRTQAAFDMSAPQTGLIPVFQQLSVAKVIEEVRGVLAQIPNAPFIGFTDENCLANPIWLKELALAWPKYIGRPFYVVSRPEFLKESVFEDLSVAGCFRVHMVVESGSDHIRRRILGRRVSNTHLLYAARACRRFGMNLITLNEVGFPTETEDMIKETIDINRQMKPDWAMCSIFHPRPGTAVFQRAESKKWLTKSAYDLFYDPDCRIEQPWIRPKRLSQYLKEFNERVYGKREEPGRRPVESLTKARLGL